MYSMAKDSAATTTTTTRTITALWVTLLVTLFCDWAVAQQENVNNLISTSAGLTREGHICREQTSCGDCIVADPQCGWCEQDKYVSGPGVKRCDLLKNLVPNGCDMEFINPKT